MQQGSLNYLSPLLKLIVLLSFVIIALAMTWIVTALFAQPVFNVDISSHASMRGNIAFMQFFQVMQSVSMFVLPSLLTFRLFYKDFKSGVSGKGVLSYQLLLLTVIIIVLGQGFITWTGWLNHQLIMPEAMQGVYMWMVDKEAEAGELTTLLIRYDNWKHVAITVVLISILPAIGEEWFFRGLLQREFANMFRNSHVAIFITAILFSAIHMQFLTFLPRFMLGLILGYLFHYSNNLWLSVLAHFANNFMAVVIYIVSIKQNGESPLDIPTENPFGIVVIMSFLIIVSGIYLVKREAGMKGRKKDKSGEPNEVEA